MKEGKKEQLRLEAPYAFMLAVFVWFLAFALTREPPGQIWAGFLRILVSRSVLVTDYMAVGGVGATLLNAALVGSVSVLILMLSRTPPSGAILMGLWMTVGFSCFGKNLFNMIPLHIGVWLFGKFHREPYSQHALASMLAATLSPAVSELGFLGVLPRPVELLIGIVTGFFIGFIFPMLARFTAHATAGYNLYNIGFAGGLVSTALVSVLKSAGLEIPTVYILSEGNNVSLAALLYGTALLLALRGLLSKNTKEHLAGYARLHRSAGQLPTDYYFMFGDSVYINMAVLCVFSTTLTLALGAQLNGPVIAGIFTIVGFGSFGKHVRNVAPVIAGAVLSAYINQWDPHYPLNVVAILFSSGLAPIAGEFGMLWGMAAGFLHVNIAMHVGYLSSGLNLYNNGFAAGFVALLIVPLITVFKDRPGKHSQP